jgi:outer membrane lipoprotein-sorting protein
MKKPIIGIYKNSKTRFVIANEVKHHDYDSIQPYRSSRVSESRVFKRNHGRLPRRFALRNDVIAIIIGPFMALLSLALPLCAQPTVQELLVKIEATHKLTTDIKANVTLTQQKSNQGIKQFDVLYYRRDADDSYLIVMTGPESEKGNGYLRMADNFWMYRKNTRTFQHINRDESIAGSNAKGEDFERRPVTELYEGVKDSLGKESVKEEKLGQIPVYKFEVKAKVSDVDYPRKKLWVRSDNSLLLKEEDCSSSGTLMQTSYFLKYTTVSGKFVPVEQMFVDEFEKGNKTQVKITGIVMDKLDDRIFTKAYLENLSK